MNSLLHSLGLRRSGRKTRPGAVRVLPNLARLDEAAEDAASLLAVLKGPLLLLQLLFDCLQLGHLLLEVGGLHLRLLLFELRLLRGAPPLHSGLQHVEADAVLDYKVSQY